jgi:hypothetical protein
MRKRPDRSIIRDERITRVIQSPEKLKSNPMAEYAGGHGSPRRVCFCGSFFWRTVRPFIMLFSTDPLRRVGNEGKVLLRY